MAVDAVVGDVELAAGEPLGERQVPLEGRLERLRPVEPLARALRPEGLEVRVGLRVELGRRVGLGREGRVGREACATRRGGSRSRAMEGAARRSRGPSCSKAAGPRIVPLLTVPNRWVAADAQSCAPLIRAFGEGVLVGGQVWPQVGVVVAGEDDPLRPRDLDAVLLEGRQQPLAQVARGRPLVGGPDRAQDLERDAALGRAAWTRSTRGASRTRRFQTGSAAISRPTSSTTAMALSMSVP